MGVRGLQTYVEKFVPDACRQVSITDMARQHSRIYDCTPVLVIDGMSLLRKIHGKTLEWVFGGQWRQFVALLKYFCHQFQRERIKLVFFFDGSVCNFKRKTWASRRLQKGEEIKGIFMYIRSSHLQPSWENFQLPASMGSLTRYAVKFLCDSEVYTSILEADQEIADFARNHYEVFGILSQDSDFFIYNTKPYLSVAHLDINNLTTVMYDRNILAQHLGLSVRLLPLFSCLVGNDAINVEDLRDFHRRICKEKTRFYLESLAPSLSYIIKLYSWTGDHNNEAEICSIAKMVFGDERKAELLTEGLEIYSLNLDNLYIVHQRQHLEAASSGIPIEVFDFARKRHINNTHLCCIYTLMLNKEYESSELMEDPTNKLLRPAALVYRPLRQRMYSVLLGATHNKLREDLVVKEWCAYHGNPLTNPDLVSLLPVSLQGGVLSLSRLWSEDRDDVTNFIRIEAFLACMELKFSVNEFFSVSSKYVALCCIINYLLLLNQAPMLERWEVNAFLAQAVSPLAKTVQGLELLQVKYVDSRAVQLAALFMRGVGTVASLLCVCGFPIPLEAVMPWNYFDGKLFHHLYLQSKNGSSVESLCSNEPDALDSFYKLHALATAGTAYSYSASSSVGMASKAF